MKVKVLSKVDFDNLMIKNGITDENVEKFDSVMFISIVDTDKENYFKRNHDNVINLKFDDVEISGQESYTKKDETKAFTEKQAAALYSFIKKNNEKEQCIVHCMAGISRSAACGRFVIDYTRGDYDEFKRTNNQMMPNARVERLLHQEWRNNEAHLS